MWVENSTCKLTLLEQSHFVRRKKGDNEMKIKMYERGFLASFAQFFLSLGDSQASSCTAIFRNNEKTNEPYTNATMGYFNVGVFDAQAALAEMTRLQSGKWQNTFIEWPADDIVRWFVRFWWDVARINSSLVCGNLPTIPAFHSIWLVSLGWIYL